MAFCGNCGAKLEDGVAFCTNCGAKVETETVQPNQAAFQQTTARPQHEASQPYAQGSANVAGESGNDDALMRAYITGAASPYANNHHYEHYKKAFEKFATTGSKANWNWGAFWLGAWNLAYRKSYAWGFVLGIAGYGIAATGAGSIITILINLLMAMFADSFHYNRYKGILAVAKRNYPNDEKAQVEYMATNGGVKGAIIGVFIALLILVILVMVAAGVALSYAY